MNRSIFDLSGGEKQKIACGCVSVCSPNIIILDEPSANLDLKSMEQNSCDSRAQACVYLEFDRSHGFSKRR